MSIRPIACRRNSSASGKRPLSGATELPTVLDSSAVLAAIQREEGWRRVLCAMETTTATVSSVNWSEVIAKLVERRLADAHIRQVIGRLQLHIEPFTPDDARRAGVLRRHTRQAGLSFGDRACLALGDRLSALVLTADQAWSRVELGIAVEQIR